jgi:surfactin synthase thioesterase subunit
MTPTAASVWFPQRSSADRPRLRLFCLHHAGAGASAYREWQQHFDAGDVEVVPVQVPGREGRFTEPPETSIDRLAERLVQPVLDRAAGTPYAFFGHSMGAVLGYHLSRVLTGLGRAPAHLFVSAYVPPHIRRSTGIHLLPDPSFVEHIARLEGTPPDVLDHPALLELLLPTLRADFVCCETYEYVAGAPLPVPITAFGGTGDPGVPVACLERWGELSEGPFALRTFDGGHFYLVDDRAAVLAEVAGRLGVPCR